MNPSEREEEYIILYLEEFEIQRGNYEKRHLYEIVKKKEEILPTILDLIRTKDALKVQVFILGKELKVNWK